MSLFQRLLLLLIALSALPNAARAELSFSTPPRGSEPAAESEKIYQGLAKLMSEAIGDKVVYAPARNMIEYNNKVRTGAYDLVLDGPHFTDWRTRQGTHRAIVMLPGEVALVAVVLQGTRYVTIDDLAGRDICVVPSSSFASVTLASLFTNPSRAPRSVSTGGGHRQLIDALFDGRCEAAILPEVNVRSHPRAAQLNVLWESNPTPLLYLSVREKQLSEAQIGRLTGLLMSEERMSPLMTPVLREFSPQARSFVKANRNAIRGLGELLPLTSYGWQ
ncbi:MAG: PhnD/SsuA/transferrin family substrate-binding protein [Halothiobacillaceae bacterium]|nr:PhnD/SsuA/transferrin family substrate-binding protein [Halothiobacillaceae bacterium]MDY0049331.1 PhnD/SsuA/transferrin family substrate-binding protein [Halothiobacillaceae bacterium]